MGDRDRVLGAALLVAGAACAFGAVSTLALFATRAYGGRLGAALEAVLFWRYALAAVALAPLAVWAGRRAGLAPMGAGEAAAALAIGGAGQAAVTLLALSALRWISVGTLAFLFYTYPAWVTVFAVARRTERLDRVRGAALLLSLAGIACTLGLPPAAAGAARAAGAAAWPGVALALLGAVSYALYIPYLGRLQARATPAGAAAWVCAGAVLLLGAAAVGRGTFTAALAPPAWAAVGALAVVCTVLAFVAFMRGLSRLGAVRTAIVSTVEPFFTAVLGAAALGQPFGASTLLGGVLIAAAVLLLQRPPRPPEPV